MNDNSAEQRLAEVLQSIMCSIAGCWLSCASSAIGLSPEETTCNVRGARFLDVDNSSEANVSDFARPARFFGTNVPFMHWFLLLSLEPSTRNSFLADLAHGLLLLLRSVKAFAGGHPKSIEDCYESYT